MKKITVILTKIAFGLLTIGLLLLSGCQKEESFSLGESIDELATLSLKIYVNSSSGSNSGSDSDPDSQVKSTRVYVDANTLGPAENAINCIRVFAFINGVSDGRSYHYPKLNITGGSVSVDLKIKGSRVPDAKMQIFVVVNEPDGVVSAMEKVTSITDLYAIEFTMAAHFNKVGYTHDETFAVGEFDIPMTGLTDEFSADLTEASISKYITVTRSVARVDVLLQKKDATVSGIKLTKDTKLDIVNTRAEAYVYGNIIPEANDALISMTITPETSLVEKEITFVKGSTVSDSNKPVRAFTFYVPERLCGAGNWLGFKLNGLSDRGLPISYNTIFLTQENTDGTATTLTQIKRNYVYKALCTVDNKTLELEGITTLD